MKRYPGGQECCDFCGAGGVIVTYYLAPGSPANEKGEWLCADCLPNSEGLDPMRGVEFPFAENH